MAETWSDSVRNSISSIGRDIPVVGQVTALAGGIVGGVSNTVIGTAGVVITSEKKRIGNCKHIR